MSFSEISGGGSGRTQGGGQTFPGSLGRQSRGGSGGTYSTSASLRGASVNPVIDAKYNSQPAKYGGAISVGSAPSGGRASFLDHSEGDDRIDAFLNNLGRNIQEWGKYVTDLEKRVGMLGSERDTEEFRLGLCDNW